MASPKIPFFILIVIITSLIYPQDTIRIIGEVWDSASAIEGAFVRLKEQNITVETASDGSFQIIKELPVSKNKGSEIRESRAGFILQPRGGKIYLRVENLSKPARLEAYNIHGRRLGLKEISRTSGQNVDLQNLLGCGFASGLYVLNLIIGTENYAFKLLALEKHVSFCRRQAGKSRTAGLGKAMAGSTVDTLVINRIGYYPLKVALDDYQTEFLDLNRIIMEKSRIPCIDAGGLLIGFINTFTFRWNDGGSGWCYDGSFWMPDADSTDGFMPLGSYGKIGYANPTGGEYVMVVKDRDSSGALANPVDYTQIWTDQGTGASNDGSFWRPVPPAGYVALGVVAQSGYAKPSLTDIVCVREDLCTRAKIGLPVWIYSEPQATPAIGTFPLAPNTFTAFVMPGSGGYPDPAEVNVLDVEMPMVVSNMETPSLPKLQGLNEPPEKTPPHIGKVMVVPFNVINDTAVDVTWQLGNSPFYRVERYQYYKKLFYMINNGSSDWPWSESITTGISQTESQTFWQTTGISITANAGFEFSGFSAGASVTVSQEFGYETSSSITMYTEKTVTKTATVPAHKIGILWQKQDLILLKRCNQNNVCQSVGTQIIPLQSYYYDEIDVP
jgi:hypothetical protein